MKQYKNGLKLAKQILTNPKFTEHGETLAMKGLTLNCLGRKDEAYDHVKRGLRNDLKSHVCWHVYGILQRTDKKYDEAIKCYRNALKWDKDNIQILRDLSLLQIQMRDLEGYRDTRYQLFKLRPSQHASWIGFAMSYHLLGDYDTACDILESFRDSQTVESHDYKHSELLLYQNQVIKESGNFERAMRHLEKFQAEILNKLAVKETKGDLCLKLERYDDAAAIYKDLVKRNPENTLYYKKLIESRRMTKEEEILKVYRDLQQEYPRAICPKRLPLDVANGKTFHELIDTYLRQNIRKGVPPLFVSLRSLYKDTEKVAAIAQLVESYVENLKLNGYFSAEDSKNPKLEREPASALLWSLYFLAQHYDFMRDTETALKYIDAAIEHTPTLIELFVTKGRIYKHAGDTETAVYWLNEAQSLDTADRYINSKCAKYMLRANQVKEAEEICAKFTREGVSAMENLNEMQCMWFQTECALGFQRMEKWGESLKKCHEVERHFAEIIEDQFDFHTYCMRKMTLRSYVGLLRLEDVLRRHPFYFKAAKCAIEVYIRLFDKPLPAESSSEDADSENLPPSELKKLRNKQRKAKKKAELETAQQQQAQVKKEQHNKSRQAANADGDPEAPQLDELIPDKLSRPEKPLEKACDFLKPLQLLAKDRIETHLMSFEIYYRKNKLLLMLQSLKRACRINAEHPGVYSCLMRYYGVLENQSAAMDASVKTVIDAERKNLFNGCTAKQLAEQFTKKHGGSMEHLLETAKWMYTADKTKRKEAIDKITSFNLEKQTLENCGKVYENLKYLDATEQESNNYRIECHKRFPYALIFQTARDKAVNKALAEAESKNHVSEHHEVNSDSNPVIA